MDVAAFLAPFSYERFTREVYDRVPLHIPAEGEAGEWRRALLSWSRMNAMLGLSAQWREENVKLILNGQPVPPDHYLEDAATAGPVRRAEPGRIQALLGMGASLVADGVENASIELSQVTAMLGGHFLGTSGANAYCSFRGIQAFRTHLDLHDVFAVHCEGEKVWRIYANREPDPVAQHDGPDVHALIESSRGPLLMEVRMRPGDLLYIPRGYYHDALASSEASLHVTFSVARHTGRVLFRLLEELAMEDPEFRAYLPDGRADEGRPLAERLEALGGRIQALIRTPLLRNALVNRQLALARPVPALSLPERPPMRFFKRNRQDVRIVHHPEGGALLLWPGGQAPLGLLEEPALWFLGQTLVSIEQLVARYPQHGEPALTDLVGLLRRAGLVEPATVPRP